MSQFCEKHQAYYMGKECPACKVGTPKLPKFKELK
jgi:hypothetical protein